MTVNSKPSPGAVLAANGSASAALVRRIPLWAWLLITIALVTGFGYLRLYVFPDRFVPLTSALVLLVSLLHRDLRLLWGMVVVFIILIVFKVIYFVPSEVLATDRQWLFATMQTVNTIVPAAIIHGVIRLTSRLAEAVTQLEEANAELEVSNEELAAREEEVTQQNEELQTQAEELEQQTEELNAQTEELQALNEQSAVRERTLADLLEASAGNPGETEVFEKLGSLTERLLGDYTCAAAVLEADGDEMIVHTLNGISTSTSKLDRDHTLSNLILSRDKAGSLSDTQLRPDIQTPALACDRPVRSLAAAPFRVGNSMTGTLEVYSTEPREWSEHELRLVQWLADQCGLIWTAGRYEEERAQLLESERSARADAERANRMKDEFVATLSHELRTPLTAVLGWASLLKKSGCQNPDEAMKGLDVIERNARHQGQLISDLLDISRIMAGKIRLDAQEVDLPLIIESAIESVRLAADAKNVHMKRNVESQNQPVLGDPGRIEQVVCNLLSNAIKFTPGGGHVEVSLTRVGSFVQLAVSDTGDGIDTDLLPYLFNRYRQADGSATRRHGGLGLGLAIAKNLVELHGGSIHAHSDGPGQGSTFTVLLPVKAAGIGDTNLGSMGNGPSVFNYDADAPSLAGMRILVVDDEEDARELIGHILRDHGAQVDMVASGEEALKRIESHPPDMLVSDIGMPGLDGYTLVKSLRTSSPEAVQQIPAVALTAFARSEDRTRALLSGFQAHIAKPVEAAELVATVASLRYAMLPS